MELTSVADTIVAGERLRTELLAALRETPPAEQAGVFTELHLFYGQAFGMVQKALAEEADGSLHHAKLWHESVWGQAIYKDWQRSSTPLDARTVDAKTEYARMTNHWLMVVKLVQAEG